MDQEKRNFTEPEIEVLVSEVEANQNVLFGYLFAGITSKTKTCCMGR